MPQPLTLIYRPNVHSTIEFQVTITKSDLLYKMYLVSSAVKPPHHSSITDKEKQAIQQGAKTHFSRKKTLGCGFWKPPSLNITVLSLEKNVTRKIYTDFSAHIIDITRWAKENSVDLKKMQELLVGENKESLICFPWVETGKKDNVFSKRMSYHNFIPKELDSSPPSPKVTHCLC